MKIAVTGATGFIGRYIVDQLDREGHSLKCWHRESSNRDGFDSIKNLTWVPGDLGDRSQAESLVGGCEAVVHAALFRQGTGFMGAEGDLIEFVEKNVVGTLKLIEAARAAGVQRFVVVSTCAVHDEILDDRPLDESHPLWATSHYGAHKAAIEKFVHSFGLGQDFAICAVRPTGVYGVAHPAENSKWFDLISAVVRGDEVACSRGGKEVHAADVAKAISILLTADGIQGKAFNCCDRYISDFEVATLAKQFSGSSAEISGESKQPKHQIETGRIRSLGMHFGGTELLRETVAELVKKAQGQ